MAEQQAEDWIKRSMILQNVVVARIENNIRRDMKPPYIGTIPGTKLIFWESMQREHPSPQGWAHRSDAELLQADILPLNLPKSGY